MIDKNLKYATACLLHHGFIVRTDTSSPFAVNSKDEGRADIFAATDGKAVNVEVKYGTKGFNLDNWREPQKTWGRISMSPPFNIPYYLFLTLGEHPANYNPDKYYSKKSWLIPYDVMIEVHQRVYPVQKTLPFCLKKGLNKTVTKHKLTATDMFGKFELQWQKNNTLLKPEWIPKKDEDDIWYGGFWTIPKEHIFHRQFLI